MLNRKTKTKIKKQINKQKNQTCFRKKGQEGRKERGREIRKERERAS